MGSKISSITSRIGFTSFPVRVIVDYVGERISCVVGSIIYTRRFEVAVAAVAGEHRRIHYSHAMQHLGTRSAKRQTGKMECPCFLPTLLHSGQTGWDSNCSLNMLRFLDGVSRK
jgi:hypothetical protein